MAEAEGERAEAAAPRPRRAAHSRPGRSATAYSTEAPAVGARVMILQGKGPPPRVRWT